MGIICRYQHDKHSINTEKYEQDLKRSYNNSRDYFTHKISHSNKMSILVYKQINFVHILQHNRNILTFPAFNSDKIFQPLTASVIC